MKYLKTKPLFLFLLPLFFCLHGSLEYFGYVSAVEVIKLGLIIFFALLLLFIIIKFFLKSRLFAALLAFYIGVWNLFFGALHEGVKSIQILYWFSSYTVLVPLLFISSVILVIVLKPKINLQKTLLYYFNILMVVYCVYDISLLMIKSFNSNNTHLSQVDFNYPAVTAKPDVYYLLFDGYPGYRSLNENFGYRNDSLYSFLKSNDFKIVPSFTNYHFTYFSLTSIFNMDYIKNIPNPDSITQGDYLQRMKDIKDAAVFSIFSSMGYSFKNLSIFDIGKQESFTNNESVVWGIDLLTHKILYRKFFKEAGWIFLMGKYEIPFLKRFFRRKDDFNKRVEEELHLNLNKQISKPKFLYAHFFLPHEPIYFDSAGNYLPMEIILDKKTVLNKNYYLGYVKYTSSKIKSVTEKIMANNPEAIVVIMSDHGYRHYTGDAISYTSDNICAVRFAGNKCLNDSMNVGGVNFFRYLFNCSYNQKLPYLKDSMIPLKEYAPVK